MKKVIALTFLLALGRLVSAQALLNEIYAFPGAGKSEFFEFFNASTVPSSMDNYTIVTYFEEGADKGFFVMDLPDLTIASRGYFVGSASIPFNYQGVSGSTASQFSWNGMGTLSGSAYLKKWVLGTAVPAAVDGNANYDIAPLPDNYNDVFYRIGGGGASYVVFVYRGGSLINAFLGGTGGASVVPAPVIAMPALFVDMIGAPSDYTINFSGYGTVTPEYVTQDIGTDNGYIRLRDGYCGAWTKSSAQVNHSPGLTNSGSGSLAASVAIYGELFRGNPSKVVYNVLNAPLSAFPITMSVFLDNGTIPGVLDANDTYVESNTEYTVTDGPFTTTFTPYNANVVIQTITNAGCIDNVLALPNHSTLALQLLSFTATLNGNSARLDWRVEDNEAAKEFLIEKSSDGRQFRTLARISGSRLAGEEAYFYHDEQFSGQAVYRIRMIAATAQADQFTRSIVLRSGTSDAVLRIDQNPVRDAIRLRYRSTEDGSATIAVYSGSGSIVHQSALQLRSGEQQLTIPASVAPGLYVLELRTGDKRSTIKFIKE